MFSKDFLNVVSKLNSISDKVIFKYPKTILSSEANDIVVLIDAEKLGCQQFDDTGIYTLSKFLNMINLMDSPEIKREQDYLVFTNTNQRAIFTLGDTDLLKESGHDMPAEIITRPLLFESASEAQVSADDIIKLKKAANIFNELNAIKIDCRDNNLSLSLDNHNKYNSSNNEFSIEYLNCSNRMFELKIPVENFLKIPNCDYKLMVKYNEERDAYRVMFVAEYFTIVLSTISK